MNFKKWREHCKLIFAERFVKDGIINPEEWNKPENKEKILFILKEPNGEQNEPASDGGTDLVASLRKDQNIKEHVTWRNINYWAYGLLHTNADNPIPDLNEVKQASERSLDKVAVINLKKIYGFSKANDKELEYYAKNDCDLILEQIKEINPDIIVTCNNMYLLKQYIIPEDELFEVDLGDFMDTQMNSKEWANIWKLKGKDAKESKDVLIIRHYHPQATRAKGEGLGEEDKYRMCCEIKQAYLKSIKK